MSDDPDARKDWRIGVLMADGTTSYEVIHDETERRALRAAVELAAHYRGRKGTNPPLRIASVQTFEEMVLPEADRGHTTRVASESRFETPPRGRGLKHGVPEPPK